MISARSTQLINAYYAFIDDKAFPCVAAKAAAAHDNIRTMVCDHMACPKDDWSIVQFIYNFVDEYRATRNMYTSAVVIFEGPSQCSENEFDTLMWQRLQSISDLDARQHKWNQNVSSDPISVQFSFSIKEEPFYVIGLHPGSGRRARQFQYPAIVFNPHEQFELLRQSGKYDSMKQAVRKRDEILSGSVNPMLADFGEASEVYQYSGRAYDTLPDGKRSWTCPFHSNHAKN